MIAAARASINKPANEVLDDLFVAADAFTAGAPQHDDMTLLLLKLES
jgi:phosphoserine phosphatase RsbU/P